MKFFYIAVLLVFSGCTDSNSGSSGNNNITRDNLEISAEAEDLSKVMEGSRESCLVLNFSELTCANSVAELNEESSSLQNLLVPVVLVQDKSSSFYRVNEDSLDSSVFERLSTELQSTDIDSYDYVLYRSVTSSKSSFFNFLNDISENKEGVDASGDVIEYEMVMSDALVPVSYAVDCTNKSTSFHVVTGDYGLKLTYKQNEKNDKLYEVQTSGVNKDRSEVINNSVFCRLSDVSPQPVIDAATDAVTEPAAEPLAEADAAAPQPVGNVQAADSAQDGAAQTEGEEAVDALATAAEETGEAIAQGAENAGEAIEEGVEVAAEAVQDGADATAEVIADGVAVADEVIDEGAAVVEGTVEAIGEQIAETATAAQDEVSSEIDEARQENEIAEEQNEEGGFMNWLRNLFN